MDINKSIGVVIQVNRKRLKMSQEELASLTTLDRSYISIVERGIKSPTIDTLEKICRGLNLTLTQLFSEAENANPLA